MLQIENVTKVYGAVPVLDNVSLTVSSSSTHALIGSSGSGKSTLLRIALGLLPMDQGYVRINQTPISDLAARELADQVGYVPQEGGLFPHLSVAKNVTLQARLRNWPRERIRERLNILSELVELSPSLFKKAPSDLSGGQRQRAAIMRAAFMDPSVLLLDEPMGALDPIIRRNLQLELKRVFRQLKKTVLIVTHDLGEAAFLAKEITLLHQGRVVQSGPLSEFRQHPAAPFVTEFMSASRVMPGAEEEA